MPPSQNQRIVDLAREHISEQYLLGAQAPYTNANYQGPWDCAEFTTWLVYQACDILLGCQPRSATKGNAYTGYWYDDAVNFGLKIDWQDALKQPGYMVCRRATSSLIGHIAVSVGNGRDVVEAAGKNLGVREHTGLGRPWDIGIRIPTKAEWDALKSVPTLGLILRATPNAAASDNVRALQNALKAAGFDPGPMDGVFGEWTEKAVVNFQNSRGLIVDGIVGRDTGTALGLTFWGAAPAGAAAPPPSAGAGVANEKYGVTFESLVPGGFFSSDPDDTHVKRSIRTNNPGALNISAWQKKMRGYVGKTFADNAGNETTIYRTPEHGVAAWYHLITNRYDYGVDGSLRIADLARRYAGVDSEDSPAVKSYVAGWRKHSGNALSGDSTVSLSDTNAVLVLARGMFGHEIGGVSPLHDDQIRYGVDHQRDNSMPT